MKRFPPVDSAALLRTDFQDDDVWVQVRDEVLATAFDGQSSLTVVDDPEYAGAVFPDLSSPPDGYEDQRVLVIFDEESARHPEHPLLLIDWLAETRPDDSFSGLALRVLPNEIEAIVANLDIANMDFDDFAACALADGIFRGFPE